MPFKPWWPSIWVRQFMNWTQTDLANKLGVSRALISHFEHGRRAVLSQHVIAFNDMVVECGLIDAFAFAMTANCGKGMTNDE